MAKSATDRVKAWRQKRERDGWVQINLWLPRDAVEQVRKYAARLVRRKEGK